MGEWKLIDNTLPEELPENRRRRIKMPLEVQLYNLSEDLAESNNLFDAYPEIVKQLTEELERIRYRESTR
jgi:hypothetical protein